MLESNGVNYLAHLYLAGPSTDLITGGFIGDSVRGTVLEQLPPTVQHGVLLHRAIDRFTDHHPVVRGSVARMRQRFGRYATVVADVFYDHFLARDFNHYHDQPLGDYATAMAALLGKHVDTFPERSRPNAQDSFPTWIKPAKSFSTTTQTMTQTSVFSFRNCANLPAPNEPCAVSGEADHRKF